MKPIYRARCSCHACVAKRETGNPELLGWNGYDCLKAVGSPVDHARDGAYWCIDSDGNVQERALNRRRLIAA